MTEPKDLLDPVRIGGGAVAGVAAYLFGYLITYVLHRSTVEEGLAGLNALIEFFGGDPIPVWKAVGWLFYNAHLVRTLQPSIGGRGTRDFIAAGDGASFTVLYAVPIVLLVGLAALLVVLDGGDDPLAGALTGAMATFGYFPLSVFGLFLFRYTAGGNAVEPDPITAILLAGIIYPLLFGAIGGGLVGAIRSYQ